VIETLLQLLIWNHAAGSEERQEWEGAWDALCQGTRHEDFRARAVCWHLLADVLHCEHATADPDRNAHAAVERIVAQESPSDGTLREALLSCSAAHKDEAFEREAALRLMLALAQIPAGKRWYQTLFLNSLRDIVQVVAALLSQY
jgi:hypothetical protein